MQAPSPFLIVGLPRSRTAWWSVVASTPQSICLHEPLRVCASFEELRAVWFSLSLPYVGLSDSGLTFQLGRILSEIEPRTLIVERDTGDALISFERYMDGAEFDRPKAIDFFRDCARILGAFHDHPLVKVVRFDDLQNFDVVQDAYRWLMPGNHWPLRTDLLQMNVQADRAHFLAAAAKPQSFWWCQQ